MSYLRQSLGANEAGYYIARFPTIRYVVAWASLVIGLCVGVLFQLHDNGLAAIIAIICGVVIFCSTLYRVWTTEIAITNLRLVYKRGLFQRSTNDLQLRAIEEVRL